MAGGDKEPTGPDLSKGIPASNLPDGAMMAGHTGDDEVLLVRQDGKLFALSAHSRTIMDRWPTACWSARPCAVHGTTRISTSKRAKRLQHPR